MNLCVVGCERSGTTVVSRLLSLGSGWSFLNDPPEAWSEYPNVYQGYSGLSIRLRLKLQLHKIVKVPGFATILPYLRNKHIGKFTALYILRDPRDVTASVLERLKYGGEFGRHAYTDVGWLNIKTSDPISAIAHRWRIYLESAMLDHKNTGLLSFIRYEDFYNNKEKVLLDFADKNNIPFIHMNIISELTAQHSKSWSSSIAGPSRWESDLKDEDVRKITDICGELMDIWEYH